MMTQICAVSNKEMEDVKVVSGVINKSVIDFLGITCNSNYYKIIANNKVLYCVLNEVD